MSIPIFIVVDIVIVCTYWKTYYCALSNIMIQTLHWIIWIISDCNISMHNHILLLIIILLLFIFASSLSIPNIMILDNHIILYIYLHSQLYSWIFGEKYIYNLLNECWGIWFVFECKGARGLSPCTNFFDRKCRFVKIKKQIGK